MLYFAYFYSGSIHTTADSSLYICFVFYISVIIVKLTNKAKIISNSLLVLISCCLTQKVVYEIRKIPLTLNIWKTDGDKFASFKDSKQNLAEELCVSVISNFSFFTYQYTKVLIRLKFDSFNSNVNASMIEDFDINKCWFRCLVNRFSPDFVVWMLFFNVLIFLVLITTDMFSLGPT